MKPMRNGEVREIWRLRHGADLPPGWEFYEANGPTLHDQFSRPIEREIMTTATEICATAANLVGGERDRTHGSKEKNFENIAAHWNAYIWNRPDPAAPLTASQCADLMELLKVARRLSGAYNPDDYVDGAGYAGCAGEIAARAMAR